MPVSIAASGSQTATLNTDHTLTTTAGPTGGGVFQLRVDTNALVNGETVFLTVQTKTRSTDVTRQVYPRAVFTHVQQDPIKDSPAIAVPNGCEIVAILRQEGGTGRAFPWALYRLDA